MGCEYQPLSAVFSAFEQQLKDMVAYERVCLLSYTLNTDHSMPEELMLSLQHTCSPPITHL